MVRQQIVESLEKELATLNKRKVHSHNRAVCELKSHPLYGKYIRELKDGRLKIKRGKVAADSRYDGKFLVETSDDTLSLSDIVLVYKQLNDVEQAFRTLKTTLELRPNYHSKDERIRCHIFVCFLALILARIVERATGKSWAVVRREMNRLQIGKIVIEKKVVSRLTEMTPEQKDIFQRLNIKEPSVILDIQ